nr:hypothetical protein [Blastochloris tepida]
MVELDPFTVLAGRFCLSAALMLPLFGGRAPRCLTVKRSAGASCSAFSTTRCISG